jgi:Rhs element Vgr protein
MKDRVIPVEATHNVATFDILINDQLVDPGYQIISISVIKEINKIPSAKIVLKDGDSSEESFKISEEEEFVPGKSIRIKAGRDRENKQIFKGVIIKHGIKVKESGETELILDCRDEAVKMTLGRHNVYYENKKDSEIIEEVIKKYKGLTHEIDPTSPSHLEMVQHHCTDWDFLLTRAEANGKLVIVDDGKISVKPPQTEEKETVSVLFGSTLIDFEAQMDGRNQWKSIEAKSWDYAGQRLFEHTTDSVKINELGNIDGAQLGEKLSPQKYELRHSGQAIVEELQEWTKSMMQISRLSKIQGRAKFTGFGELKPGQLINLQGVGARFTGKAYVSAVRQDVYNGSWYTQAQFGLKPDCFSQAHKDIVDIPAAGLVPAINGLQIGKVVQLQDDPEGENRILVRLPIIDNKARGVWARVTTLDAGQGETNGGRGSFFLPEIEDEVIVGFINDDPRDAVILGMVNSSARPAPINAQDSNHEKGFVTRSKMRVHFNDDTKTITIDTPAGNSITLDESTTSIEVKDQNENHIKMNPSGIELKSATTKLSADGITEVKGSLVNIN